MRIYWVRWEQTEDHETDAPDKDLVSALNVALDTRDAVKKFIELWRYWWIKFPNACVLVTMTTAGAGDGQELRFWFDEPSSFGSAEHVDSNGRGLIVDVRGRQDELRWIAEKCMNQDAEFEQTTQKPKDQAHRSEIVMWRRQK